jgi:glutamine synthetase
VNPAVLSVDDLLANGYSTVIVASPDLQGRLVGRRVPAELFARVAEAGIEVCTCVYAWDIAQDTSLIESNAFALCGVHNGLPDTTFMPDLTTLRPAAWLNGVAFCFADPIDRELGEYLPISPRTLLRRELEQYERLGLRPYTGTELEFYLFLNDARELRSSRFSDPLRPTTLTSADFMIHEGNMYESFFQKLRADLIASGVEIETAQSEYGTGQWEITFRYTDPLEMADRHALYKLAVRDSAAAAGMSATFMAKPLNGGQPGSSCHVHVSMTDVVGVPVFWSDANEHHISPIMRQAMAGALDHVADYMAWYAPTINSYRRANAVEAAGWGRTWGIDNRTTTIRVVGHSPRDLRFEFRLAGADTNPYLTLAALLSSARDGISRQLDLRPMTVGNSATTPLDSDMAEHLGDAANIFGRSEFIRGLYGDDIVDHFTVLLHHEWRTFLAATSSWDLERYFDRI